MTCLCCVPKSEGRAELAPFGSRSPSHALRLAPCLARMSNAPPPHPLSATGREAAAKGAEEERGWTRSRTARTLGRGGSFAPTVVATESTAAAAGLCKGLCRRSAAGSGGTGGNWGLARAEEPRPRLTKNRRSLRTRAAAGVRGGMGTRSGAPRVALWSYVAFPRLCKSHG